MSYREKDHKALRIVFFKESHQNQMLNVQKWYEISLMIVTERIEEEVDLSLILPEPNVSLNYCISHYSTPQKLTGHDQFFCDTCKSLQNAEKSTLIQTLPNFLSVHLRRFKYDETRKGIIKLMWLIPFPQKTKIRTNHNPQ